MSFQIKEIQETDAGIYKCEVIISLNNKVSAEVELIVRRPPIISDNSTRWEKFCNQNKEQLCIKLNKTEPSPKMIWVDDVGVNSFHFMSTIVEAWLAESRSFNEGFLLSWNIAFMLVGMQFTTVSLVLSIISLFW